MFGLSDLITKIIAGSLVAVVAVLGIMLLIAKGDARHFQKLYETQAQLTASANAKLSISNASIDTLTGALDAKNAESEARAKAYTDAQAANAATIADLDKRYASTKASRDALQAIAKVATANPSCKVPMALSGALEGL